VTAPLRIDVDDVICARERKTEDERMQHVMSNAVLQAAQLCDDGVSDMRRGWRRTPALSVNGREQSVIIAAAARLQ